jgi:hypothetical protein
MNGPENQSQPVTKADLHQAIVELERFVVDREASMIWKVVLLQVTVIGAIASAQWVAFSAQLGQVQNLVNQLLQHLLK